MLMFKSSINFSKNSLSLLYDLLRQKMFLSTSISASLMLFSTATNPNLLAFCANRSNCSFWYSLFIKVVNESIIFERVENPSPKLRKKNELLISRFCLKFKINFLLFSDLLDISVQEVKSNFISYNISGY